MTMAKKNEEDILDHDNGNDHSYDYATRFCFYHDHDLRQDPDPKLDFSISNKILIPIPSLIPDKI
jgi:hypothetical protein